MKKPIFRFAPSPNGHLHLGHAYSALLNQKMAREADGKLLLRIEDIDTTRCTPELETQILNDLEWIGFEWDEAPRRQSEHFEEYQEALNKLREMNLLYPANMSRGKIKQFIKLYEEKNKIWPRDPDGSPLYPGKERELDKKAYEDIIHSQKSFALRLDVQKAYSNDISPILWNEVSEAKIEKTIARPNNWGDVILARKDTPTSYHLCCVVDDAIQGITHVVRGKDLYEATSIHSLLQNILDLAKPLYHHHKLILDDEGQKLSKSKKHKSLKDFRNSGLTRNNILEILGFS